jgi:uncharacterized membrane protein YphA (DoxX/SURF4 family)
MTTNERKWAKMDLGLLFLRGAGLVLCFTFGTQKIGWAITYVRSGQQWSAFPLVRLVDKVGFPLAGALTLFAILCESIFAFLVAIGFFTRILSILIALCMIGALYTSICINDPIISKGSALQYMIIFSAIAIIGPGKFAIGGFMKLPEFLK